MHFAIRGGKLLHKPHIPMLKEASARKGFFEREQFEALRAQLPEHVRPAITALASPIETLFRSCSISPLCAENRSVPGCIPQSDRIAGSEHVPMFAESEFRRWKRVRCQS